MYPSSSHFPPLLLHTTNVQFALIKSMIFITVLDRIEHVLLVHYIFIKCRDLQQLKFSPVKPSPYQSVLFAFIFLVFFKTIRNISMQNQLIKYWKVKLNRGVHRTGLVRDKNEITSNSWHVNLNLTGSLMFTTSFADSRCMFCRNCWFCREKSESSILLAYYVIKQLRKKHNTLKLSELVRVRDAAKWGNDRN